MQRQQRAPILACVIVVFVISYYLLLSDRVHLPNIGFFDGETSSDLLERAKSKESLGLSPNIVYSRTCIKTHFANNVDRQEVVNISKPLIGDQVTLALNQDGGQEQKLPKCTSIKLSVPKPHPPKEQFPDLIFGMSTTLARLNASLSSIAHWSSGRGSKLIAIVVDGENQPANVSNVEQVYRNSGIQATFIPPYDASHTTSQSHFMVLTKMVEESGPETKWFGILDDDTFFPHLKPLSAALGHLDHTADMYVGVLSEDFPSVKNFGIMAYGGAGAYLSAKLAKRLGTLEHATRCLKESNPDFGDIIVRDCIFHHSKAKLTILPGLYQHDLLHDLSGFFESGVEPLNLHHWKSWYHEPVEKMAVATSFCGNCFLQRWRFGTDTVFSNGYSIVKYRGGFESVDLDRMEKTWGQISSDGDPQYDFVIGPLRQKISDDEKKTFKLVDAEISNGVLKQLYLWKGNPAAGVNDEVVELVWNW
ncbi:hypothetical protein B0O99DRAFT_617241 [Bisporella sp. PMI_857]|nr:hypothetical protein B0O99DRAFT_617241 [Bisporella sp. PMI_857]